MTPARPLQATLPSGGGLPFTLHAFTLHYERREMTHPISRYPVQKLEDLPQNIRANDEFYLLGRVPPSAK